MSYAKGKNFNVVFLPLRYSAGDTYRGSGLVSAHFKDKIRTIFTKFGMRDNWVSVLLGIAFRCCSSFAYRVKPKYSYFQYLLISVHLRQNDSRYFTKIGNKRLLCL